MGNRIQIDFTFDDSTKKTGKYLVFDIETTGFPINKNASPDDFKNWPFVVQIAWLLFDDEKKLIENTNSYIKQSVLIPADATNIHGITTEMMLEKGIEPANVYASFKKAVDKTEYIVCHNIDFDIPIVHCDFLRNGMKWDFPINKMLCTMKTGASFCRIPLREGEYKWPKLTELYQKCFYPGYKMSIFPDATSTTRSLHDANIDACMTAKCFFKLIELGFFKELKSGTIENSSPTEHFENNFEHLHEIFETEESTERGYYYYSEIKHIGLGTFRVLRDDEKDRLYNKVKAQFHKWDEQWIRISQKKKVQTYKEASLKIAEERTRDAQEKLKQIDYLLIYTIDIDDTVIWDSLKDKKKYDVPNPKNKIEKIIGDEKQVSTPIFKELPREPNAELYKPQISLVDKIFSFKKEEKIKQAESSYQDAIYAWRKLVDEVKKQNDEIKEKYKQGLQKYEEKKQAIINKYEKLEKDWNQERELYYKNQNEYNVKIDKLKESYFRRDANAVIEYCEIVLNNSKYPDTFPKDFSLDYNVDTKKLIVEYFLPTPDDLPSIKEVKYISSKKELREMSLPEAQVSKNYDSAIYKISLRTLHELFEADKAEALDEIVFNGVINSINKATGKSCITCIITIKAKKSEFCQIDLLNIDPKICFNSLNGIGGDKFSRVSAVNPIAQIKR